MISALIPFVVFLCCKPQKVFQSTNTETSLIKIISFMRLIKGYHPFFLLSYFSQKENMQNKNKTMNAEKKQFRARAFFSISYKHLFAYLLKNEVKHLYSFLVFSFFAMNNVLDKKKKAENLNEYDDLKEHVKSISTKKLFFCIC